jgi:histidinol-phosphate aminotransferase
VLRLDANEGRSDPALVRRVLDSIDPAEINRYPSAGGLEATIAARWGIERERVVVTNGADDAIDRVCRTVLNPGSEVLIHDPTFVMIEHNAKLAGAAVRRVAWMNGAFPNERFIDSIDDSTRLVAIVSPNNPTGRVVRIDDIRAVAARAREVGCVVLVDLAYVEFADADPTEALLDLENIVIVRTFSKAYGLASARVGYAVAPDRICDWIRACGSPYPCSGISLSLAAAAFEQGPDAAGIARVQTERTELENLLRGLGAGPIGSSANFVLARFDDAGSVYAGLIERGIRVRSFGSDLASMLRISLPGDEEAFGMLTTTLRVVMNRGENR